MVKICDNEAESQDEQHSKVEIMDDSKNVFKLPPELLTKILLFCDGDDVVNFAEASLINGADIENVISNKKLWEHPVISPDVKFTKYLGSHTKSLYIDGSIYANVSRDLMKSLTSSCIALEMLVMMDACLDEELFKLPKIFPKTLSILKFEDMCFCRKENDFYSDLDLFNNNVLCETFGDDLVEYEGGNDFTVTFDDGYPH